MSAYIHQKVHAVVDDVAISFEFLEGGTLIIGVKRPGDIEGEDECSVTVSAEDSSALLRSLAVMRDASIREPRRPQ